MTYNTKTLKKDSSGAIPVAQVYNQFTDDFEVLKGEHGAMRVSHQDQAGNALFTSNNPGIFDYPDRVKEAFESNTDMNKTFTQTMRGFGIVNDADLSNLPEDPDIVFSIPEIDLTFTVKPGEIFDNRLDPFVTVEITSSVPFRAWGRG